MEKASEFFPEVAFVKSPYEVAEDADAVVLVTEWNEFKLLDLDRLRASMRGDIFFDGRNLYDPARMVKHGFRYHCVGRPTSERADSAK
jgi:UDPglucose 6-dehydrogenase